MSMTNAYCTLDDLKKSISITGTDSIDDAALEAAISAVSRNIDDLTGRFFYADGTTGTNVIRYYTARHPSKLFTDDFVSISEVAIDTSNSRTYTAMSATDYLYEPVNNPRQGKPYTQVLMVGNTYGFPQTPQGVRITGIWGWSAVPEVVRQACLIQSSRVFMRAASPFGIAGATDYGTVTLRAKLDVDVQVMLQGVNRNLQVL